MKAALALLAALASGCAPRAPMALHPAVPISRLHEELAHITPGTPVIVHIDSLGRLEGRFVAGWNNTIALAQRPGDVVEITGFDTLWVHQDRAPVLPLVVAGVLTGQATGMLINRNGKLESVPASYGRLIGAAAGMLTAHLFRDGWHRAYARAPAMGPRDTLVLRLAPATALRAALAAVPLGTRVRVFMASGVLDGKYAGIWGDSLRFADRRIAIAPEEVLDIWWRPAGGGAVGGTIAGGLAGLFLGVLVAALVTGDYPDEGAVAGITVGGFTLGAVIGGLAGGRDTRWTRWR